MATTKPESLLELADNKPPFLVYAIARNRRLSFHTLVKRSGLSERTFCRIISKPTWAGAKIEQVDAVCKACGETPVRIDSMNEYLKKTLKAKVRPFRYLSRSMVRRINELASRWAMLKTS